MKQFFENKNALGLLFMLPAGALLLVFLTYPLGLGIWLGFTDAQSTDQFYVVLASPSGVILRQMLPSLPKIGTAVEWVDDAHLQISIGLQSLKFEVVGRELHPADQEEYK